MAWKLSDLFGGAKGGETPGEAVLYEGYSIQPTPRHESGHWLTAGVITKAFDGGETKEHQFIRAETHGGKSDAEDWVRDLVKCSRPFSGDYLDDEAVNLTRIGNDLKDTDGEWIGVARLSPQGSDLVRAEIKAMGKDASLPKASLLDLFARLADRGAEIRVIYVPGQWLDVDDAADITRAGKFL